MKQSTGLMLLCLTIAPIVALAQVPQRDEAYWKAQQQVEFTRRNAVEAQDKAKNAGKELQDAIKTRERAEQDLQQAREREAAAQKNVPASKARAEAAVRDWQAAVDEFERIRK